MTDVHSLYVEKTILGAEVDQVSRLESAGMALKLADRLGSAGG